MIKDTTKASIILLLIYALVVALIYFYSAEDLHDRAVCCGLYGYYQQHFLPFPLIKSSEQSHFGGGPIIFSWANLCWNIALPIAIAYMPKSIRHIIQKMG